jgi:hypothetical protein
MKNFNLQNALDSFYGIKGGNLSFGPPPERGQDGKAKRETLSSFLQRGVEDDMELAGGYMDYMPMNNTNARTDIPSDSRKKLSRHGLRSCWPSWWWVTS